MMKNSFNTSDKIKKELLSGSSFFFKCGPIQDDDTCEKKHGLECILKKGIAS
jgi:hypothetical protein